MYENLQHNVKFKHLTYTPNRIFYNFTFLDEWKQTYQ